MRIKFDHVESFPGGSVVKNSPANAGDKGSIPGLGKSHNPQGKLSPAPQLLKPASPCSTREASPVRSPCRESSPFREKPLL